MPEEWEQEIKQGAPTAPEPTIDYAALVAAVEKMEAGQFASVDMDSLMAQFSR